jgi:hypothetical protein
LVLVIALYLAGIDNRLVLLATPFAVFVAVCFLDRTGWMIRMAIAELGVRQRERWRWGNLPIDSLGPRRGWRTHADAPPIARAPVLATAGRHDEARALVASATAELPQDALNLARLRILFDAEARDDHSVAGAVESLDATPELAAVPARSGAHNDSRSRGRSHGFESAPTSTGGTSSRTRSATSGRSASGGGTSCSTPGSTTRCRSRTLGRSSSCGDSASWMS